ncbi:hypothetical protein JST97_18095 [bacterium]|nr:hypothetical protein [bacterium]
MKALGQHCGRFALGLLATLFLLGAGRARFDWSEDARWELLGDDHKLYSLNQTIDELQAPADSQEIFTLPVGLLVRQRNQRAVNLTVLRGHWSLMRDGQSLGEVGQPWNEWQAQVGDPTQIYVNPQKVGQIYYYRASLLDLGLMVAEGKVLSLMFVEPGYLRQALERSGYSSKP